MIVLAALLAANAVLHGGLVARFGVKENEPFLVFTVVYAVLAIVVFLSVPYALWATLVLAAVGLVGLTVTFNKPQRDKTLDKIIWGLDALCVIGAAWLLFAG
jgi:hypothetical protein